MQKNNTIIMPKYPLLFAEIIIFSLIIIILIRLINPIDILKRYKFKQCKNVDEEISKKTIIYIGFIMKLWPWRNLINHCLVRSLILFYFLRKTGLETRINFGIKDADSNLTGHAWLTLKGKPYLDCEENLHNYTHMFTWPN